jgi:hypothetical protein
LHGGSRFEDFVHEILLPDAVTHLHPNFLTPIGALHVRVLDLQRVDRLLEVRRGSLDLDRVADRDPAVRQANCGDADFPEEMEDLADFGPLHGNRRCMGPMR